MLLTVNGDSKTVKGQKKGYLTGILYLASGKQSGYNVCPSATAGCLAICLYKAGRASMIKAGERTNAILEARKRRTRLLFEQPEEFNLQMIESIRKLKVKAKNKGLIPVVRLNGTSDLEDLALNYARLFPDLQFYDYTANFDTLFEKLPENYHLTFSRKENNWSQCVIALKMGFNVSVVFDKVPPFYLGYKVINGDETDLRFLDEKGVIIGLKEKRTKNKEKKGFVVRCQ
jgi:hypothetical protein